MVSSQREREESQAAASECQAQPLARAGLRMRSEARRAAEASSAVRPSGQPRERERVASVQCQSPEVRAGVTTVSATTQCIHCTPTLTSTTVLHANTVI